MDDRGLGGHHPRQGVERLLWGDHGIVPVTRELWCAPDDAPERRILPRGHITAAYVNRACSTSWSATRRRTSSTAPDGR